jgi:polyhydroxyalkanoate synthesis regulator phasin
MTQSSQGDPADHDVPADDPMASVRPYLALASGILGVSAAKAAELAQGLWAQGGDVIGDTVGDSVKDVVGTAVDQGGQVAALLSPDQIRGLVREEVDRIVRRLGFAREDEVASLRREVGRLEQQVGALHERLGAVAAAPRSEGAADGKESGKKHKGKKHDGKKHDGKKDT